MLNNTGKGGLGALILAFLFTIFSSPALAHNWGKLLEKKCTQKPQGVHCYLKYEKADVWTLNGKAYAYTPINREAFKKLHAWDKTDKALWYSFLGLQTADIATTAVGVFSGKMVEANPLLSWIFKASAPLGLGAGIAAKIGYSMVVKKACNKNPKTRKPLLGVLDTVFLGVVLHNLWILF